MMGVKNRIVGSGVEKLDNILFNPRNWRIHPLNQQNALNGVLDEVGWVQEVIVNQRTGNLVDGHLRCQLASRKGETEIPVKYVDLSEEEEALVLATIDPIGAMAATDKEKLDELFTSIQSDNTEVNKMLEEIAEKERLEYGKQEVDAEPQIDRAAELNEKWQVKTGDLWKIGEHRLLCGDSTKCEDVDRVIGECTSFDVLTDPPYNIGFNYESINDDMQDDDYQKFCNSYFDNINNSNGIIITPGPKNERLYPKPRDKGIWFKPYAMAGASCFHTRHCEPILFYGKFSQKRNSDFFDYSSQFPKDLRDAERLAGVSEMHAPAKSIPLWTELIGMLGPVVLDVFGGTGTTMIVAENTKRKSMVIELSPIYCAVILERMSTAFPKLEISQVT
jgi:hypothetical protein